MDKTRKNLIINLLIIYSVILISIVGLLFFISRNSGLFSVASILSIIITVVISFVVNYFILKRRTKTSDLNRVADIIIAEIFNDQKLNIDYSTDLEEMLKKLNKEKKNSMYSMEKYRNAEKIRSEFTANVTHELKTPLTSIMGYAELIEMGMAKEEEVKIFAKTIREDANKLFMIIDDIIILSKYDDPTSIKMEKELFNIKKLVDELSNAMENVAMFKKIKIYTNLEDMEVFADKKKIKDLINNLISNAIKYNVENGRININLYRKNNNCVFEVEDTGIGIKKSHINRIFERFYVVDKARGKKAGTGLGLAIVKHVAIVHDGTIEVKSEKNKGSKFIFTFPIVKQ